MPEISDKLRRRVAAVNRANDLANRLQAAYIEAARPLVGKKITKIDGSLTESAKKHLAFADTLGESVTVQRETYQYWLTYKVTVRYDDGSAADRTGYKSLSSESATFNVGKVEDHILTALADLASRKTNYDPETIARLREQLDAAQKVVRDLESQLSPFGEYDR